MDAPVAGGLHTSEAWEGMHMRDKFFAPCVLGVVLMVLGVLLILASLPCRVWQALLGAAMAAAGFSLWRRCGNCR